MIVQLQQIGESLTAFDFTLAPEGTTKLEQRFSFSEMRCHAELKKNPEDVFLKGRFQVTLNTSCDFCLDETALHFDEQFDLKLIEESANVEPEGDIEIPLHAEDVECYKGQEINLATIFEDQLILELPLSIRCKEECRGICANCGQNLNEGHCQCEKETRNNPFAVLKNLEL